MTTLRNTNMVDVLAVIDAAIVRNGHRGDSPLEISAQQEARDAIEALIHHMDDLVSHTIGCEILLKISETETLAIAKSALARVKGESA